jgi:hypothetical protein
METLDGLRQALPAEEFMRECLGWWDEPEDGAGPPAIDLATWRRLGEGRPAPTRARWCSTSSRPVGAPPSASPAAVRAATPLLLVDVPRSRPTVATLKVHLGPGRARRRGRRCPDPVRQRGQRWDRRDHRLAARPGRRRSTLHRWELLTAKPKTPPPPPRRAERRRRPTTPIAHVGF